MPNSSTEEEKGKNHVPRRLTLYILMGEETENKLASLWKLCKQTASEESKLRTCPMARESEKFADPNSQSSSAPTSPEPTAMVMVSLPDSSNSIDQSTGNDDEFHTPPEQRFYSSSEDQAVDCAVGDPTADDPCCEGEENSGSGLVELKKNRVSDRELCEDSMVKKARVYEDLNSEDEFSVIEISDSEFDEKSDKAVDSPMKKSKENGGVADAKKYEVPKNGECNAGSNNGELQMDRLDESIVDLSKNCVSEKVSKLNGVKVTEGGHRAGRPYSAKNPEDFDKFNFSSSSAAINNGELEMDGLDESVVDMIKNCKSLKVCKSNAVNLTEGKNEHKDCDGEVRPCSTKNPEDIDKFKFCSPSVAIAAKRRKATPSVKGKEKNVVENERTKNGLLMDLLQVLNVGIGDEYGNSKCEEEVDFLETAKRLGITFPKPRWWPAQGFVDEE